MKNDLTCGVVRDLLPSYVEGLLGTESQEAVDRHLAGCSTCAAALAAMQEPVAEAEEQSREVDFLKKVKRRNNRRVIAAAICTAVILLGALLLKVFVIGTPLQAPPAMVWEMETVTGEEGDVLRLSVMSSASANAYHGWRVEVENGIASVTARDVLVSPLYSSGSGRVDIPLEGVQEVWLGGRSGRLVWQDGVEISPLALELLDAKAPYCGDPMALERIAEILRLPDRLGSYTLSLQTGKHPYGCTLEFANRLNDEQINWVTCYNLLTLALVDNMEASMFRHPYPEDAADPTKFATSGMRLDNTDQTSLPELVRLYNEAHGTDWEPKASIKDYTRSPADLQRLLMILDSFYKTNLTTQGG